MKALMLTGARSLEHVDVDEPDVGDDTVLIRVAACGICGSDVHGYDLSTGRRQPPIVMGHEAAGVVERVGAAVTRFAPGDRVTFDSTVFCGGCRYCDAGKVNLCDNRQVVGVSCGDYRRHGAFADYVAVPELICHALPDGFPIEHAALIESVSIALHAVARTPLVDGGLAVVVGAGMIGTLAVQALAAAGVERIVAVDVVGAKLELAARLGATGVIDASVVDPVEEVLALTGGTGASHAFEVVGATAPVRTAVERVEKGGTVTLVGNVSPTVEAPLQSIVTRELTLYGSCGSQGDYPRAIELMAEGAIDVAPLISACVPLSEGAAWFERLHRGEPGLMKVILRP
ncbi:MAG: galactitol-1-phosphate 5-dehydrogenase [Actinomycetota bacterium]|nr:galactitol-1-phosphate 5-dehydrogenase [Actinomycetota bacterium]